MNQFNRIKVKRYEKWQINQNFWKYFLKERIYENQPMSWFQTDTDNSNVMVL